MESLFNQINLFNNDNIEKIVLEQPLDGKQRAMIHEHCKKLGLMSETIQITGKNEKTIISIDNVIQYPIAYSLINHSLNNLI